jgi:hypothetical protein
MTHAPSRRFPAEDRWQERFMQAGYDSLLRDKTCPSRIRPLGSNITERVVTLKHRETTIDGIVGLSAPPRVDDRHFAAAAAAGQD